MAGRERVPVAANESLEHLLDRLRSSQAEEIVLDVDERSPLLLSVPNLDSLDETAQHQGIRLTIASTSSKVLNAARVFGLPVIDTTAAPSLTRGRPDPNARLLAGEPLGEADAPVVGGVAVADEPEPEAPKPTRPAPVIAFRSVTVGEELDEAPDRVEDDEELDPDALPHRTRERMRRAATPSGRRTVNSRVDPYGQPYREDDEDEATEAFPTRQRRRPARPQPEVPAAVPEPDEEGWENGLTADADDDAAYQDAPRPGLFDGVRAFWTDVRERVTARRQPVIEDDEDEADEAAPAPEIDDDGWDEPPYRQRVARATATPAPVKQAKDPIEDTGELPPPVQARPARTIRSLNAGRVDTYRQPTDRLYPVAGADDDADEEEWDDARPVVRRGASGGLVWALLGLVAVALVAVLVAYVLVPRATVTLVARTGAPEIGFNVVVGEIDPNSPAGQPTNERIVVPAQRILVPVNASATKAATGVRLEPDIIAGGPVILGNSSNAAVNVPKGTILTATDGRTYVTIADATVPPVDLTTFALGSTEVKVAAQTRGSAGNAAIGLVRGQLSNGIVYNNRDAPIAGGSDKRISTIAKADLAAAQAAAEDAARGKWQAAIKAAIPAGTQQMHDTAGLGPFKVEFSAKEGGDGDSVVATVTAEATTLVYNQSEIEARARAEAEKRISTAANPGESIISGSVQIGTPQLTGDVPGTLTYRMTATARSRAAIGSDADREQLVNDLAHQSDDEAHATLARLPGVSSATIDYDTGPFPRRMPWLASHIRIEIAER